MIRIEILLLAVVAGCAAPSATPLSAQAAPVTAPSAGQLLQARLAGMHMSATLLYQGILPRAKGTGDLKDIHYSQGIEMWAAAIPGLFPAGSDHPQSRARPEVWTNAADFKQKAVDLAVAAAAVTAAGKAGDLNAYAAAAERLKNACSACHSAYREE